MSEPTRRERLLALLDEIHAEERENQSPNQGELAALNDVRAKDRVTRRLFGIPEPEDNDE
jgi:hypothetical protein